MTDFNTNMLSPVGFSFNIKRAPEMNFFVQSVSLPGPSISPIESPNPFRKLQLQGDSLEYGELVVSFKINEDLSNYIKIFDWIIAISFPDNFDQYKEIATRVKKESGDGLYSDATLTVLSSGMNPIVDVRITDLFPISLSPLEFNSRDTEIDYMEAQASFRFQGYVFAPLT